MDELLDPKITPYRVSQVMYDGKWEEIKVLRKNPIFSGYLEDVWVHMSKDYDFFWTPWYPLLIGIVIMLINLYANIYEQFYSAIFAFVALGYITYAIPFLNRLKEKSRIESLDEMLFNSQFHRSHFSDINDKIEKEMNLLLMPKKATDDPTVDEKAFVEETPSSKDNPKT